MTRVMDTTTLADMLWKFMGMEDPMLSMLAWLCTQMMAVEVNQKIGAGKHEQQSNRSSSRSGYRPRRLAQSRGIDSI